MKDLVQNNYQSWVEAVETLARPLLESLDRGESYCPDLLTIASNHDAKADELESFARPFLLLAHYLCAASEYRSLDEAAIVSQLKKALLIGTDPQHANYWGDCVSYHQNVVEVGAIVLCLELTRTLLWDCFADSEKKQIADWLSGVRGLGYHQNNHMYFGIIPLEFLRKEGFGEANDSKIINRLFEYIERMHLGDGWFEDGMNETVDYYNAYAFHFYSPWWIEFYGKTNPERAKRWKKYLSSFLESYQYFFAASGEQPPFGRSMTYRFNATVPFGLAAKLDCLSIPVGRARTICTKNFNFFMVNDCIDERGFLTIGWKDEFIGIREKYSCSASPYWAAKALAPLTLPPTHSFWTSPSEDIPAATGDYAKVIEPAEILIRAFDGQVELINCGSSIFTGNIYFGAGKWGRNSYRTGVGFEVEPQSSGFPMDNALTIETKDGNILGRHKSHPLVLTEDHVVFAYNCGSKDTMTSVYIETYIWFKGNNQLQLHLYRTNEAVTIHLGGFSLANVTEYTTCEKSGSVISGTQRSEVDSLYGFDSVSIKHANLRTHIYGPSSAFPLLSKKVLPGRGALLATVLVGECLNCRNPQQWQIDKLNKHEIIFKNNLGEYWHISNDIFKFI